MTKFWKYIFFIFGFSLVIISWNTVSANSFEFGSISCQKSDMQTPDGSSTSFSVQHDVCEDEQIEQGVPECLIVESFIYISNPLVNDLICKICLIPWEPPKK